MGTHRSAAHSHQIDDVLTVDGRRPVDLHLLTPHDPLGREEVGGVVDDGDIWRRAGGVGHDGHQVGGGRGHGHHVGGRGGDVVHAENAGGEW